MTHALPLASMTDFGSSLRAECRPIHDGLDQLPAIASLASPRPRHDHYIALLRAMSPAVMGLEQALRVALPAHGLKAWLGALNRGKALHDDIEALGLACACDPPDSPRLASVEHCLAALYVLEGSRLGGRVMANNLAKQACTANLPRSFLSVEPPRPLGWRLLLGQLAACPGDTKNAKSACALAAQTLRSIAGRLQWPGTPEGRA